MSIDLETCGIFKEDILSGLVDQLAENFDREMLREARSRTIEYMGTKARETVDSTIRAEVDTLMSAQFQPINVFGDACGKPTTIRQILETSLQTWWTETVDARGKPVSPGSYDSKTTRAEYLVRSVLQETINKELSEEFNSFIRNTKTELKKALTTQIAKIVEKNFR